MLKIETNKDGQIFISGDKVDLTNLRYQIDEAIDHQMTFTKTYDDFQWNSWDKNAPSKTVTLE